MGGAEAGGGEIEEGMEQGGTTDAHHPWTLSQVALSTAGEGGPLAEEGVAADTEGDSAAICAIMSCTTFCKS